MTLLPLAAAALLAAQPAPAGGAPGRVCGDPTRPCPGFRAHDLSFVLPRDGKARAEARSTPFLAVILRSAARCEITEAERAAAQSLFPAHKVFATRFECDDDPQNAVTYTSVDAKHGFLAVYAGNDKAAAKEVLAAATATGKFPGANLRRMQAVLVFP